MARTRKLRCAAATGAVAMLIFIGFQQIPRVAAASVESPDDILIVANNNVKENSATLMVIRDIFLKIRTAWSDGKRVTAINSTNEQLRNDFRNRVLNMNAMTEQRYWEDQKVKSGLSEPAEILSNLKAVFKLEGSVSYVYRKDFPGNVAKVLLTIPSK